MNNFWKVGMVSVAAATLFGAVCTSTGSDLGGSVDLKNGDLVQYGTTIYVFEDDTIRGITTPAVFAGCGYAAADVKVLEQADYEAIAQGPAVNSTTDCPGK